MAQIKDSNVIKTPQITVDPRFFLPDDIIDVRQKGTDSSFPEYLDDNDNDYDVTLDVVTPSTDALSEPEGPAFLSAPQSLVIISQTIRMAADGRSVVDLVLSCEDVPGATTYEVRVTK